MKFLKLFCFLFLWVCFAHGQVRIVGGSNAKIKEVPWQVSLHHNGQHNCGGVIISKDYILTAAHCVDMDSNVNNYKIYAGLTNQNNKGVAQVRSIRTITKHPLFIHNGPVSKNDIAILELAASLNFNSKVKPIHIASLADAANGLTDAKKTGTISGWGYSVKQGGYYIPTVLQSATVPIVANSTVQKLPLYQIYFDIKTMLAVGRKSGSVINTCRGDSGGPFAIKQNNIWKLAGIASWGPSNCTKPNSPGVFTRVSSYYKWIISKTLKLEGPRCIRGGETYEVKVPAVLKVRKWTASAGLQMVQNGNKATVKILAHFGGNGTVTAELDDGSKVYKNVYGQIITASVCETYAYDWMGNYKRVERLRIDLKNVDLRCGSPRVGVHVYGGLGSGLQVYDVPGSFVLLDYPVGTFNYGSTQVDIDLRKGCDSCGNDVTKFQIYPNKTFYLSVGGICQ